MENEYRFFGAVVERSSNEEAFLPERPLDIILKGNYNHVPLIMGYNAREGMAFDNLIPYRAKEPFFRNMELSVPFSLNIARGSTVSKEIANKIQKFYFGNIEQNRKEHLVQYYDVLNFFLIFFILNSYFSYVPILVFCETYIFL